MKTFLIITLAPYSKAWQELNIKTASDMVQAWNQGYDFKIQFGPACSNRDIELMMEKGIEGVFIKASDGSTKQINF